MDHTRRGALRLLGGGATIALAGCLGPGGDGSTLTGTEPAPVAVRSSRPNWHDRDEVVGFVAVIDGRDRAETALSQFDRPAERAETVDAFVAETDFQTERLLLVETVGPNACYSEVEFSDLHLDGGSLTGTAQATPREADACAEVITYPSALLRATFEGAPAETAEIEVRDGWGHSAVLAGSTTTDLAEFAPQSS